MECFLGIVGHRDYWSLYFLTYPTRTANAETEAHIGERTFSSSTDMNIQVWEPHFSVPLTVPCCPHKKQNTLLGQASIFVRFLKHVTGRI